MDVLSDENAILPSYPEVTAWHQGRYSLPLVPLRSTCVRCVKGGVARLAIDWPISTHDKGEERDFSDGTILPSHQVSDKQLMPPFPALTKEMK